MNGYITTTGDYYETDNGPRAAEDVLVPLRPTDAYDWSDTRQQWVLMHPSGSHQIHAAPRHREPPPMALTPENTRVSLTLSQWGALGVVAVTVGAPLAVAAYQLNELVKGSGEMRQELGRMNTTVQGLVVDVAVIKARHAAEDRSKEP